MTMANRITMARIVSIPVFAILVLNYTPERDWIRLVALGLFAASAATDALDGLVARHWHQKTHFGSFLDPLADKLLINVGFLLLAAKRDLPVTIPDWVTVIVLGRDIIIVAGVWFISQFHGPLKFEPRILSKITTCFQMASLLSVMLALGLSMPLLYATSGITVLSGADYILAGSKKISEPVE